MIPLRDTIPSRRRPVMTWTLIAVNALVFVYEAGLGPDALEALFFTRGMVPARLTDAAWATAAGLEPGGWSTLVSSMFLHGGFFHLLSNLWILWIFGDNVEDLMGPVRFLGFYLASGLAAGGVHLATNLHSAIPVVGASGAIAGVLGGYLLLFPGARVVTLVPVFFWPFFFELPAMVYLGFWFVAQVLSGAIELAGAGAGAGIAWWAHVGGFVAGLVLCRRFVRGRAGRRSARGRPLSTP